MDIVLNGRIKSLVKDFGFIYCEETKNDYFFNQTIVDFHSKEDLEINKLVTFKLRANKGREGYHAIEVKILHESETSIPNLTIKRKNKYYFESKTDLVMGLRHIAGKLVFQKSKCDKKYEDSELLKDKIDELLELINDLLEGPSPNFEDISIDDINESAESDYEINRNNNNYWRNSFSLQDFGMNVENISSRETEKGSPQDFSIIWHEWKDNERQIFHAGYIKGYFNYSFMEKGATEQTSVYDSAPPIAKWKLNKIEQKGYVFYITSAPVREIAQSSSVPALPPKIGVIETAERILNKDRNVKEWQREIDPARIRKIKQFIGESSNIIANTPMLYIHDENAIKIHDDELIIDFSKFLKKQSQGEFDGKYIDRKLSEFKDEFGNDIYDDFRPFWIIDGQHRVRGIHLNEEEQNLQIPLIVFPKSFSMSNTAKVFAEINTLQKKLNPLHELFMQHRFSIDHPTNIKRKFKDYTSVSIEDAESQGWSIDDWIHSRANHLAYEILAKLAKNGPLKNRIQFLPQNEDNNSIYITADQWVNYARVLFERKCYKYMTGDIEDYVLNPSDSEKNADLSEIFYEEINNYFHAWVETCNHFDWPDNKSRWVEETKGKGLIQRKTHFILLIELYSLVRDSAFRYKRENKFDGVIKIHEFMEILKPFKWVDWPDKDIEYTYPGSGEKGRRSLEVWMADAILNGQQFTKDEIFDLTLKSKPGRGINSILDVPTLEVVSENTWPTPSSPVRFKSKRPWNARYESSWKVEDINEDIKAEYKIQTSKHLPPMDAEFVLKHEKYMDDPNINELSIRVDWKNSHTHTGKKIIKINKPINS